MYNEGFFFFNKLYYSSKSIDNDGCNAVFHHSTICNAISKCRDATGNYAFIKPLISDCTENLIHITQCFPELCIRGKNGVNVESVPVTHTPQYHCRPLPFIFQFLK